MPNVLQICFFVVKMSLSFPFFWPFQKGWCVASCRRFSPGNQGTTFLEPGRKCFGWTKKNIPSRGCSCTERSWVFQRHLQVGKNMCAFKPQRSLKPWMFPVHLFGCWLRVSSLKCTFDGRSRWWMMELKCVWFKFQLCANLLAPLQLRTEFEKRLGLKFLSLTNFDGFLLTNAQLLLAVNIWKTKERWWCDAHQR